MKKEKLLNKGRETFLILVCIVLGIFFLLLNSVSPLTPIRNPISFVFEPIFYQGSAIGSSVRTYFDVFTQLTTFQKEYSQMAEDIAKLKIEKMSYDALFSENESLKKQISFDTSKVKVVMAGVVRDDDVDILLIDKGTNDGIREGDVVTLGNMFVGIVAKVDSNGSQVRLASSKSSHLEVVVFKIDEKDIVDQRVLSRGIVSGSADGIKVENMSMNSAIKDGDVVFVNDSRVGGFLVLGYLVGLSQNPADTSRSGYISTVVDYDNLTNVFVRVGN